MVSWPALLLISRAVECVPVACSVPDDLRTNWARRHGGKVSPNKICSSWLARGTAAAFSGRRYGKLKDAGVMPCL
jgi:hypothetical protein